MPAGGPGRRAPSPATHAPAGPAGAEHRLPARRRCSPQPAEERLLSLVGVFKAVVAALAGGGSQTINTAAAAFARPEIYYYIYCFDRRGGRRGGGIEIRVLSRLQSFQTPWNPSSTAACLMYSLVILGIN